MEKTEKMLLKAINAKCLDCVMTEKEVRACNWEQQCPLHPFRLGKLPDPAVVHNKKGGENRG